MRTFLVGALLVLVSAGGSQTGATRSATPHARANPVGCAADGPTDVRGGSAAQQRLGRMVLARLGAFRCVTRVEFVAPAAEYSPPARSTWLRVTVSAPDRQQSGLGTWQALLVVGAIRDLGVPQDLPVVAGKTIVLALPDGSAHELSSSVVNPPIAAATPQSAAELTRSIRGGAAHAGASIEGIAPLDIAAPAVDVTVTVADPRAFVVARNDHLQEILGGIYDASPGTVDGAYLEVRDTHGSLVTTSAYSARLHEGFGWTRPDLVATGTSSASG